MRWIDYLSSRGVWRMVLLLAVIYLAFCILLYVGQTRLIYFPSRRVQVLPQGFELWTSPAQQGVREIWGFKRVSGANRCLFFFHGNGGNASGWSYAVEEFPGDIFVLEYPGYGERDGISAEATLKAAATEAFVQEADRYDEVIVCGQSLGAAVAEAIITAHPEKVDQLVLITPFLSLAEMARAQFPWLPTRLILRDRMEVFEPWKNFPGQSVVVIAGRDEIIPRKHSLRFLVAANENRRVFEIPGATHNSVETDAEFWRKVLLN